MSKESTIRSSLAKRAGVIALSVTLGMTAFAGTAFAYFTSNTQATGGHTIQLGYSTDVNEEIVDGNKRISMTNTGNTDVMVRIQLFYGTGVNNSITVEIPGAEGWTNTGDTWTYSEVLMPGASTTVLPVNVTAKEGTDLSSFDITVIGQTSPVYYDEDGNAVPYLWQTQASGGEVTPVNPDDQN